MAKPSEFVPHDAPPVLSGPVEPGDTVPATPSAGPAAAEPTDFLGEDLAFLDSVGLRRSLRVLDAATGPWVSFDGRRVLLLCSNDYQGLASHAKVKAAAQEAIDRWGAGAGAARLISGT